VTATSAKLMMLQNTAVPSRVAVRTTAWLDKEGKARPDWPFWRIRCSPRGMSGDYLQQARTARGCDSMVRKLRASRGDAAAYDLGRIYAQWGDSEEALKWVSAAMRIHSLWLEWLKTGPVLDPLRKEPRFQAIERELKFPQ
jgi:hypothetical protein